MAKLPESKERRLQGLNQDVLAVATPVPGPDLEPINLRTPKKTKPISVSEGGHSGLLWLSLVLAVIAVLPLLTCLLVMWWSTACVTIFAN